MRALICCTCLLLCTPLLLAAEESLFDQAVAAFNGNYTKLIVFK